MDTDKDQALNLQIQVTMSLREWLTIIGWQSAHLGQDDQLVIHDIAHRIQRQVMT